METILNSHISLHINGQSPQGFALLDQQSLGQLKYQVAQDIERELSSDSQKEPIYDNLPPPNIVKILDRVGHDVGNSAIAKYLHQKNQVAIQELLTKLNLDAATIATLESIDVSEYLHKLESDINQLLAKISELSNCSAKAATYESNSLLSSVSLENMQGFYGLTEDALNRIKCNQPSIDELIAFNKQVRTKWFILRHYLDMAPQDAQYVESRFSTYSDFLNEVINLNRDSPSYFEDLFAYLHDGTIRSITDEYALLWGRLSRHIAGEYGSGSNSSADLLDIIAELQLPENNVFLPIKDKFTTEQLEHNAEVLNADLTKFALADLSKLAHSELIDLAAQYQIKIKKSQAITKELHNRAVNRNLSIANKVNHLLDAHTMHNDGGSIVNVYQDFFAFIINNDLIVHKWNLLELLQTELAKLRDGGEANNAETNISDSNMENTLSFDEIKMVQVQLEKIQADKDTYVLFLEYKKQQELTGLYEQLILYYEEIDANTQRQLISDAAHNLLHSAVAKLTADVGKPNAQQLPNTTLNLVSQSGTVDCGRELTRILENQEQIKQMLATSKKNKVATPRFKKISSTGTSDSEHDESREYVRPLTPQQFPSAASLKLELSQLGESTANTSTPDLAVKLETESVDNYNGNTSAADLVIDPPSNSPTTRESQLREEIQLTEVAGDNAEMKTTQTEEPNPEPEDELPESVSTIEEAAIQYNQPEYITRPISNLAYFCRACNKQLKFGSTKPIAHCKTTGHNKKFLQWVNKNNLVMH